MRLIRGSAEFLADSAAEMRSRGAPEVYSPALYPGASRTWRRAGFVDHEELVVMERMIDRSLPEAQHPVELADDPDWDALADIDRRSFEGFWRMGSMGIAEAMQATPKAALLYTEERGEIAGYAIVGIQMTVAYLQRIAVVPELSGKGMGSSLVRGSLDWSRRRGARSMVLNVRPDNDRAAALYDREGFGLTGTMLKVLRFEGHRT